jgi:hypothetical protein
MLDAGADLSLRSKKNRNSYSIFYLGLLFYSFVGNANDQGKAHAKSF